MSPLTVTQVNTYIKALLDESKPLRSIFICGEISNFVNYYKSGHIYFTLKDDKSQIKAVMFASYASKLKFEAKNGMKVICFGRVSAYEKDGIYQIYVQDMQPSGIGSITIAYEQLKEKLEQKGYFDNLHKKAIPKYPKKIGVATSNQGAAVEDIKNILGRRFPLTEVVIVPTIVQGDNSGPDIAKSIKYLDSMEDIDLIIVGRGGGSIEDLWGFNTEIVADAVYSCSKPIISAVGHETDFTICDFVSDMRAPTPSAAAELAVPDYKNELISINNLALSLEKAIDNYIKHQETVVNTFKNDSIISNANIIFDNLDNNIKELNQKMNYCYTLAIENKEKEFARLIAKLDALSPISVLNRGFALVNKDSIFVKSVYDLTLGDAVNIRLKDGFAKATIDEVINNER